MAEGDGSTGAAIAGLSAEVCAGVAIANDPGTALADGTGIGTDAEVTAGGQRTKADGPLANGQLGPARGTEAADDGAIGRQIYMDQTCGAADGGDRTGSDHEVVAGAANGGRRQRNTATGIDVGQLKARTAAAVTVDEGTGNADGHGPGSGLDAAEAQVACLGRGEDHGVIRDQAAAIAHQEPRSAGAEIDGLGQNWRVEVSVTG